MKGKATKTNQIQRTRSAANHAQAVMNHESTQMTGFSPPVLQLQSNSLQPIQRLPKKQVSGSAITRLGIAKDAIRHTKEVFSMGAGNQAEALKATNFNTYYRLVVQRDSKKKYWKLTPQAKLLADSDPIAFDAAKADITKGGNCGEHATVAFDYLDAQGSGQRINKVGSKLMDHAFVILGDLNNESKEELVVSDPWPTQATATLWEDHMAFEEGKSNGELVDVIKSDNADGKSKKAAIAAGLTLTQEGKDKLQQKDTDAETDRKISEDLGDWIWDHQDSARMDYDNNIDKRFDYFNEVATKLKFETASAELTSDSKASLKPIAKDLISTPHLNLNIEGHTDSVGSKWFNKELSKRRAESCYKELLKLNVPPSKLSYIGYGEEKPIASNSTKEGRAQNRRVEFKKEI